MYIYIAQLVQECVLLRHGGGNAVGDGGGGDRPSHGGDGHRRWVLWNEKGKPRGVRLGVQSLCNDSGSQRAHVAALLHGHRWHGVLNDVGDERDLLDGGDGLQRYRRSFGVRRSHGRQQGGVHRAVRMGVFVLRLWHVSQDQESAGDRNLK